MIFGKDMIDLVPAGTIEDLVRSNGADVLKMLMQAARNSYGVGPEQRISLQLIEHRNAQGEPTIIVLPQILTDKLVLVEKKPYYDLLQFLQRAPIAKYITDAKATAKVMKKLEPIMVERDWAVADGDTAKMTKCDKEIAALIAKLPTGVVEALGIGAADAKKLMSAREARQLPAAETGDGSNTDQDNGAQ
jgi:hypothetical protein